MIFSIADLQSAEENFEAQEGEEGATADAEASYPLRCSFTITKVHKLVLLPFSPPSDEQHAALCPRRFERRCRVPRGRVCDRERIVLQGCKNGHGPHRRGRLEASRSLHRPTGAISGSFFHHRRARALKLCLCQFETLDLNLQEEFERFLLQERGIDESLALFVPEYAQYKEQKVGPVRPLWIDGD